MFVGLFYRYYFGHYSEESAACISPPVAQPHSTHQESFAHNYCVEFSNARINQFNDGFFPYASRLWNSHLFFVFLASFNLPYFKRQVYHHLRNQMARFFFFFFFLINFFLHIPYITIPFFRYFLRDTYSLKGAIYLFCVPIHKKKKKMITDRVCSCLEIN